MYNRYCAVIRASIHTFHVHIVYVSERNETQSSNVNLSELNRVLSPRGGGGHLGIFWVGMCRPGLQIGTPF